MIRLSAFADEAAKDLEGQIAALKRNGIPYIEVRGINGTNVADLTEEEAATYAKAFSDAGIRVWSIGSPLGKVKIDCDYDAYLEKVAHVCRLAKIFGTEKIRMFSFKEAYESEETVYDYLRKMVKVAEENGVQLYHENEKRIFGDTVERVLKIRDHVEGLKFIYDPANFLEVGEDSAYSMKELHGLTDYFHIKDVISETGELVPAGYGDGRIGELVAKIGDDDKVLTLEPHLAVFDGYAEIDESKMKNKFCYASNGEAFDAAVTALKKVLAEQGYAEQIGGFVRV